MTLTKYQAANGKIPFDEWLATLDQSVADRVLARLIRLMEEGHYGDHSTLKGSDNVIEMRFTFGPGYRIYCHKDGGAVVILLCAGSKKNQRADAAKAARLWRDSQARKGMET